MTAIIFSLISTIIIALLGFVMFIKRLMGLLSHNKKKTFEQHDNESPSFYRYSVEDISIFNKLDKDIDVDICVIGGGLTGVSSALNLAKKGYKVVLIEARKIGSGASGRNGGQLGIGMRKDQFFLENMLIIIKCLENLVNLSNCYLL